MRKKLFNRACAWLESTIQKRRRRKEATINNIGSVARNIIIVIIAL